MGMKPAAWIVGFACWCAVGAPVLGLTEREVLEAFSQSPHRSRLLAEIAVVRAAWDRRLAYPDPSVSTTFEGAGRTDFFMVEQPLALNGRRGFLRLAGQAALSAAELDAQHAVRQAQAGLRAHFFQLVHAQLRREALHSGNKRIAELVTLARLREEAGEGSRFERLQVERELVETETELAQVELAMAALRQDLGALLGERLPPGEFSAEGSLEESYALPALADALRGGLARREDFSAVEQQVEQLELEGKAADRLSIPNPVVSGGVKRADAGGQWLHGPVAMVSVSLPVFAGAKAERRHVRATASRAVARREALRVRIVSDVQKAHGSLRRHREMVREYRQGSWKRAGELLRIAHVAHREGEIAPAQLLDFLLTARNADLRLLDLQAAAKQAEIEFDRSVARELMP